MQTAPKDASTLRKYAPAVSAGVWCSAVALALMATLQSLGDDSFDGLNNLFQIPFALPWFLLPLPTWFDWSYATDAWATAAMGWLNGLLLYCALRWALRPRSGHDTEVSAACP